MNGELMRGFGLRYDGYDRFRTTQAVQLGRGQHHPRRSGSSATTAGRAGTTPSPTTRRSRPRSRSSSAARRVTTRARTRARSSPRSSGDTSATTDDAWVAVATPTTAAGAPSQNGPSAVVNGTPGHERVGRELPARPVQPAAPRHRARGQPPGLRAPVPARRRRDQVARPFRGHRNGRAARHRLGGRQRPARRRHRGQRGPQRRDLAGRRARAGRPQHRRAVHARQLESRDDRRRACPDSTRTSAPASSSSTRPPRRSRRSS